MGVSPEDKDVIDNRKLFRISFILDNVKILIGYIQCICRYNLCQQMAVGLSESLIVRGFGFERHLLIKYEFSKIMLIFGYSVVFYLKL